MPPVVPSATSVTPVKETPGRDPVPEPKPLLPERARDERDPDRKRAEDERDRGRRGEPDRVDEGHLVQPDPEERRDDEESAVRALDANAFFPHVGERREEERRGAEAKRGVRERREPVREGVLRCREMEAPEDHREEKKDVRGDPVAEADEHEGRC
jgi:hypothetical protein